MPNAQSGAMRIGAETIRELSDRQLLERFVALNDQAAFAGLLERYGQTVWGVCRRVLRQEQDVEDAFQAVFFLLARKAASIRKGDAVGSWLYGVAFRIAMNARRVASRRQITERQAPEPAPGPPPWGKAACEEFQRLLDEEVERLADKYRAPFVLCCLEGMSREEAARELGWKEGTLSSRLAHARKLLQKRLVRRGVTLTSALTAVALAQQTAAAAAPSVSLQAGVGAVLASRNGAAISPSVAALVDGYVPRRPKTRRGVLIAVLLAVLVLLGGLSLAGLHALFRGGAQDAAVAIEPETFVPPGAALGTPIGEQVLTVAFSADGKRLVTAGAWATLPGQLKIWDVATTQELVAIGRIPGVLAAAFSPDGQTLATGDAKGGITLRDPLTGEEQITVPGHAGSVHGIAFSPDSELLASASWDQTIKLWSTHGLQERKVLRGHSRPVTSVVFFRHGQALVSTSQDGTARIWDLRSDMPRFTLQGHHAAVEAGAVSPDDTLVATASSDETIRLWDAESGAVMAILKGNKGQAFFAVAFSPDGKYVAAAGRDGTIPFWDVKTLQSAGALEKHAGAIWALAFSRHGTLASGSSDKTAKLWRLNGAKEPKTLVTSWSAQRPVLAVAYSPDGNLLAVATKDKTVHVRDAGSGDVLMVLAGHTEDVVCLAFAPDGKSLVSGSLDKTIKIWDPSNGAEIRTLTEHTGAVQALTFAPDGKTFASAGDDQTIHLWDPATGKTLATLLGHTAPLRALAFAPDGLTLACGGVERTIKIWDLAKETEAGSLQGHDGTVRALAFSKAGVLASAAEDATVKLWDPSKGSASLTLEGHTRTILALAFSPKGGTLVSAGQDGTVRVWDPVNGQSRGILKQHKDAVTSLAIHPCGHNLVSGSQDTLLLRWQAAPLTTPLAQLDPSQRQITAAEDNRNPPPGVQGPKEKEIAPAPPPPVSRRGWLVPALAIFGALTGAGLGIWLLTRRNRRPGFVPQAKSAANLPSAATRWAAGISFGGFVIVTAVIAGWVFFVPRGADAPVSYLDQPLGTQPVPGIEEEGFHSPEFGKSGTPTRWTNGTAKLVVPLHGPPPKALHVRLSIPVRRPMLRIRINGQEVFDERPAQDKVIQTFDLSKLELGRTLTIEILSDTFVPAEQGRSSADARTLGVRVLSMTLRGDVPIR